MKKKESGVSPDVYHFPSHELYDTLAGLGNDAYQKLANSHPQKAVNQVCAAEAALIRKIADARNLDEMIGLESRLQSNDLEKYARSESDVQNVQQGLTDWQRGINSYNTLKHKPKQYRETSEEFTDRNRDKRLDVPKDGMRYALASQMTRLQNRRSLQLTDEERELLSVRRILINAILQEYSSLQKTVVHGK